MTGETVLGHEFLNFFDMDSPDKAVGCISRTTWLTDMDNLLIWEKVDIKEKPA
jgi:hypothetical protein